MSAQKGGRMDKQAEIDILEYIEELVKNKFTGNIQINFSNGGITNMIEKRSLKVKQIR